MSGLRVLIVDDYPDARESLAILVRLWGHEVWLAQNGPSALAASVAFRPHVVLLDLGLPGLDGWEVGQRLRREFLDNLLLIAVSGFGMERDLIRSREAGFDLHLVKPTKVDELQRLLAAAVCRFVAEPVACSTE